MIPVDEAFLPAAAIAGANGVLFDRSSGLMLTEYRLGGERVYVNNNEGGRRSGNVAEHVNSRLPAWGYMGHTYGHRVGVDAMRRSSPERLASERITSGGVL